MQEMDYKAIGRRVRAARLKKGLTQEKLGELCGLSTAHIGHIERGTRVPSLQTTFHIASALEIGVDQLLLDAAAEPKMAFSAILTMLQGKNERQVRAFLSAVKALAEKIDEL